MKIVQDGNSTCRTRNSSINDFQAEIAIDKEMSYQDSNNAPEVIKNPIKN